MKKKMPNTPGPIPPLETGQVWQCKDGRVLVGLVGKTLVHFKFYRPDDKRAPVQLVRQQHLKSFLQKNRAVLQQESGRVPVQVGGKKLQLGRSLFNPPPSAPASNLCS